MKMVVPVTFQTSHLINTDAVETEPQWTVGATFDTGDKAWKGTRLYESLTDTNSGNDPETDTVNWLDIGPRNVYAMFDDQVTTQTSLTDGDTVVLRPGQQIDSIALAGLTNATSVQIVVYKDPDGTPTEIYNETFDLDDSTVIDWYTYFFEPFDLAESLIADNIPPYSGMEAHVTFNGGAALGVGALLYGTSADLGDTIVDTTAGIRDYSTKTTDEFGTTTFVKRGFSKRQSVIVKVDNTLANFTFRRLSSVRATPTVWSTTDDPDFKHLTFYGYVRDWNAEIRYKTHTLYSIDIEGLT